MEAPLQDDREDDASDGQDEGGDAERETLARRPCRALVSEGERVDLLSHVLRQLSGRARLVFQLGEPRIDTARTIAGVVRSHSSAQRVSRREDCGGVLQNRDPGNHADHYQVVSAQAVPTASPVRGLTGRVGYGDSARG